MTYAKSGTTAVAATLSVRASRVQPTTRKKLIQDTTPDQPVIYVRKSSEADDEQAASHERQLHDLDKAIRKDGFDSKVLPCYQESRSAKEPGRPLFNEMMSRILARELNVIYAHEISRLVRNMDDGGKLIHALQKGHIRRIVTPYRTYLPEDNTLLIAIEASVSTEEIRTLKRRVESSIGNKHAKGQYPGKAPIGYINDLFGVKGDRAILPDPERFEIVHGLWRKMLTGAYSVRDLTREAKGLGLSTVRYGKSGGGLLSYSAMHAMFCNPFYCGLYQWAGTIYQGCHKPMIMVAEFERVQGLLTRTSLPRPHIRQQASEIVPYMGGLFTCGSCSGSITAETHVKTNKSGQSRQYVYLRCTKKVGRKSCPEKYVSLEEFEQQTSTFLESLTLPDSIADWTLRQLREENAAEQREQQQILRQLEASLSQNQAIRKRLTDLLLAGRINEAEFDERRSTLSVQGQVLKERLEGYTTRSNRWLEEIEGAFVFCRSLKSRFDEGTPEQKRMVLELVGSNRCIQGKKVFIQPDDLFAAIQEGNENGNWRPRQDDVRLLFGFSDEASLLLSMRRDSVLELRVLYCQAYGSFLTHDEALIKVRLLLSLFKLICK